jgi:hypothetical protein
MYPWLVYLHVLATMSFLIVHGVSSVVAWRLKGQRDPATARAWLELNTNGVVIAVFYGSLLVLLLSGVVAGFMGDWWGQGWIWLSVALLIGIIVGMYLIGTRRYSRLRQALGMPWFDGRREHPAGSPAPVEEIHALLANSPALDDLQAVLERMNDQMKKDAEGTERRRGVHGEYYGSSSAFSASSLRVLRVLLLCAPFENL